MSDTHLTDVLFESLDLEPQLTANLRAVGFERCTPIQAEALPLLLSGTDVSGQAQTGTGKTVAFLLAIFNYLLTIPPPPDRERRHPLALVVAPTRELAVQIHHDALQLLGDMPFKLCLVFGGVDYDKQRDELAAGVDILIGTPGRLLDYYKQRVFSLSQLQVVVLDEADRMFDLGFIKDIRFLFNRMPPPQDRLSMLFSATLSFRVNELAYEHMNNPVQVRIDPDQIVVEKIRQVIYHVSNEDKIALLIGMLQAMDPRRTMVFVNTKGEGDRVARYLVGNGFTVGLMTGDVPQRKRLTMLRQFQDGEVAILVATDVAARGLHIPDVTHVINYDLPQDAEDYVHRIGRTARVGNDGDAISFGCETWVYSLPEIEQFIGRPIPMENCDPAWLIEPLPPAEQSDAEPSNRRRGGGGDKRPANKGGGRPRSGHGSHRSGQGAHRSGHTSPRSGQGSGQGAPRSPGAAAASGQPSVVGSGQGTPGNSGPKGATGGERRRRGRRRRKPGGARVESGGASSS